MLSISDSRHNMISRSMERKERKEGRRKKLKGKKIVVLVLKCIIIFI
jgi:hypothetical protein